MKGSIAYRNDVRRWFVRWQFEGKEYKIYKYNGEFLYDKRIAQKLLACMQADQENANSGLGSFRIEKYLYQQTDVIPYLQEWLKIVQPELSPATYKDYHNSVINHLIPWFQKNPVSLQDIRYDTLCKLLNNIDRAGKGKLNVIYCLRRCMDFAWKSGRILIMPPFPERGKYGIVEPEIKWISETRQMAIISAIPAEHQPIFWWLKYHLRRPSEAMALFKEDYDKATDSFIIRRAFSNKQLVAKTKTKKVHIVPCHPDFKNIMRDMPITFGRFFFVNPHSRLEGKHYQHDYLVDLWHKASETVGEDIDMYSGLKHSSCSQYINEKGLSIDELQMLTDHARRESVLKYAAIQTETKRRLMLGNVIKLRAGNGRQNDKQ